MSNVAINRIISQMEERAIARKSPQVIIDNIQVVNAVTPISLEELKKILLTELVGIESQSPPPAEVHFDNIYDFIPWYQQNKDGFSQPQQMALNTLVDYRAQIDAGCACKRAGREMRAHQYFEQFWLKNKDTDLLSAVASVAKANKISINAYCSYTR